MEKAAIVREKSSVQLNNVIPNGVRNPLSGCHEYACIGCRETEFLEETRFLKHQSAIWLVILKQNQFLRK